MKQVNKVLLARKMKAYDKAHSGDRAEFIKRRELDAPGAANWLKYVKKSLAAYDKMQRVNRRWYAFTIRMAMKHKTPHVDLDN